MEFSYPYWWHDFDRVHRELLMLSGNRNFGEAEERRSEWDLSMDRAEYDAARNEVLKCETFERF